VPRRPAREYDWSGKVVWEHRHLASITIPPSANGNTIFLGWGNCPLEIAKTVCPADLPGSVHPDGCMYGDFINE